MDKNYVLFIFVQQEWHFGNIKLIYFSFSYYHAPCSLRTITAKLFPREEEQRTRKATEREGGGRGQKGSHLPTDRQRM